MHHSLFPPPMRPSSLDFVAHPTRTYVPPSWHELAPLLYISVILWLAILIAALVRYSLYSYINTSSFRAKQRIARSQRRTRGPLIVLARALRYWRILLVRNRFPQAKTAYYFGVPRFVCGIIVCILYIADTYAKGVPSHFYVFQCLYGVAVSFNLLLSFVYAERPILFSFSPRTFVECLSIPSLLLASGSRWLNFNFLQAYCVLMQWEALEKHDIVMRNSSALPRLLTNLFLQLLTFLFVTSCGVQFFELLGDPLKALRSETFQITWANAVYFAIVTLMTVGYGDFVPYTLFGRMWIVLHIIFAAYLVSKEISLLIEALKSMRRGGGTYVTATGTSHVVVTGRIKWKFLQQFVIEFLAEPANLDTRIVVLTSNPTWTDDEWHHFVSRDPFFDHHLMFLDGSALRMDDLSRAQVQRAKGVFVLADPHRSDPYKEDSDILKTVLTIRNFSGAVPIYALNALNDSSFQFGIAMEHLELPSTANLSADALMPRTNTMMPFPLSPYELTPTTTRHDFQNVMPTAVLPGLDMAESHFGGRQDSTAVNQGLYSFEESVSGRWDAQDATQDPRIPRKKRKAKARKSENLCTQELETVLLAENTFCNGLSTLIANATLRVAPQTLPNDRPWLVEYKLGAECTIQQFTIRKEMDGIQFRSVATMLQDFGVVMLAIKRPSEKKWTLLTPSTPLEKDMSAMALSYHDSTVIVKIINFASSSLWKIRPGAVVGEQETAPSSIVGARHGGESSRTPSADLGSQHQNRASFSDGIGLLGVDEPVMVPIDQGVQSISRKQNLPGIDEGDILRATNETGGAGPPRTTTHGISRSVSMKPISSKRSNRDRAENSDDRQEKVFELAEPRTSVPSTKASKSSHPHPAKRKIMFKSVEPLPTALYGHVIICLDGESPLLNLDLLLRRIWRRRAGQQIRTPVVVIHPRFPKNFARRLGSDLKSLFLLQGNSLSLETLKQAQYQTARAFLIMASESKDTVGHGSTDSKSIFTVMTLDSLLADLNAFVCCILDAEESLQLLRAPRQARRVRKNVRGYPESQLPFDRISRRRSFSSSLSLSASTLMQRLPSYSTFASRSHLFATLPVTGNIATSKNRPVQNKGISRSSSMRFHVPTDGISRSTSMRFDEADTSDEEDDGPGQTLGDQRSRELYERQRYASGEMVISSLFTALLARDYTNPGYIRLIRQLIGSSSDLGSWIRHVEIPAAWTDIRNPNPDIRNPIGDRTYRETSLRLLAFNCIALGLYRSGAARVRLETKSEKWERGPEGTMYQGALFEDDAPISRADGEQRPLFPGSFDARMPQRSDTDFFPSRPLNQGAVSELDADLFSSPEDWDFYWCPTTKRRIYYSENDNQENVLPYVYTCPEPYTVVSSSDLVFVLCDPSIKIPTNWGIDG